MAKPTKQDIDMLLAYLPVFADRGFPPGATQNFASELPTVIEMGAPTYHPAIEEFLSLASSEPWRDADYGVNGGAGVKEPDLVAAASLDNIKAMLTYLVRGERFSEGSFGDAIEAGHIQRVLRRLKELSAGKQ